MNNIHTTISHHAPKHAWTAQMIAPETDTGVGNQSPYLYRKFHVAKDLTDCVLRISALGLYKCFLNGRRVGDDILTPGWTSYWDRLSFQTYEISNLLKPGDNTIEIWLGDGWYRSAMLWKNNRILNTWGAHLGAIVEISCADRIILKTDESWHSGLTPIIKSGIYFGEIYDARQEELPPDHGTSVLDDFDPSVLIAHEIDGVKELKPFEPIATSTDEQGRVLYDFGQNCAGYLALEIEGESGAHLLIEHAELMDRNGKFDRDNLRAANASAEYILKGEEIENYRPSFTFFGFRHARITISGKAKIISVKLIPISSMVEQISDFSCAHPLVNRLVQNTIWSQRSNFIEVPTDCPQRDERLGWTGDAQVFAPTACYLHESGNFLRKWLRDVMADQRPEGQIPHVSPDPTRNHEDQHPAFFGSTGWGDAICIVPWVLWTHYGDKSVLEETLDAMERWGDYLWSISDGPIIRPPRQQKARGFTFGDWLQPAGPSEKPLPTISDDAAATIYFYIASILTAKAADIVGNAPLSKRMWQRASQIKQAFQKEFITPAGRVANDDQTSYALAIMNDLIPPDKLKAAGENFKAAIARSEGRIGTGFIGTPVLLSALGKIGATELAAAVFLQEEAPGWLYQVKNGATTIWERWDAIGTSGVPHDSAMNSYNHYAYGAVCQWLFESVAGFRPDENEPGFKHIIFEPLIIPALGPVKAHYDSVAGKITAAWQINDRDVTYTITVPEGAHATFVGRDGYRNVTVNGVAMSVENKKEAHVPLKAGHHEITFQIGA